MFDKKKVDVIAFELIQRFQLNSFVAKKGKAHLIMLTLLEKLTLP